MKYIETVLVAKNNMGTYKSACICMLSINLEVKKIFLINLKVEEFRS